MPGRMTFACVAALFFAAAGFAGQERAISGTTPWLCYYGDDRRVLDVEGYRLLILDADIGELSAEDKAGRLCLAYISVGEAEDWRWFWPDVKDKPWVLGANPDWPDSRLVDPRSEEWRRLVLDVIAPRAMEAGFDGFLLDTVDTAETLLEADPDAFRGADEAMAELIRGLRAKYPRAVIVPNGGFDVVSKVADAVDAMMYEGTFSTWRELGDGEYGYSEIDERDKEWLRPRLAKMRAAGLTILALEYVDPGDAAAAGRAREAVIEAGDNPYVSTRELDVFPGGGLPPASE